MFPFVGGIPLYPVLQFLSWVVFFVAARRLLGSRGIRTRHAWVLSGLYMFCNIILAKLLFDLFRSARPFSFLALFSPQHYFDGGFWGWLLAFLPVLTAYPFLVGLRPWKVYGAIALTLPGVIFVQKLACLTMGCCAGAESALPWAVVFPVGSQAPVCGVPVHPLQLYDGLLALGIGVVLLLVARRRAWLPLLFPLWVLMYAVSRFASELLRPSWQGSLSLSQHLELVGIGLALLVLTVLRPVWTRVVGFRDEDGERQLAS